MKQAGMVIWFTGLSGAGKTSIAEQVVKYFEKSTSRVQLLDGDLIRDFCPTGFSKEDRVNHIKRVGLMASLLEKHGVIVVASLISPYQEARDHVRLMCRSFHEIYVSTSLEVCEQRDVKGLYQKARNNEIQNFTGISDPYEAPIHSELYIETDDVSLDESVSKMIEYIEALDKKVSCE